MANFSSLLLDYLSTFLQGCVLILPFIMEIKREKKITRGGVAFIFMAVISVALSFNQNRIAQENEENYKTEIHNLDSTYNQRLIDSLKSLSIREDSNHVNTIEILAKYGLKVDSSNNEIIKAIDTSKSEIAPELDICYTKDDSGIILDSVKNNIFYFTISLCDFSATANNINLKIYAATFQDGVLPPIEAFPFGQKLKENGKFIFGCQLHYVHDEKIFFLLTGDYTNTRGNKKYPVNSIYEYDLNQKGVFKPLGDSFIKAQNLYKKKGILK